MVGARRLHSRTIHPFHSIPVQNPTGAAPPFSPLGIMEGTVGIANGRALYDGTFRNGCLAHNTSPLRVHQASQQDPSGVLRGVVLPVPPHRMDQHRWGGDADRLGCRRHVPLPVVGLADGCVTREGMTRAVGAVLGAAHALQVHVCTCIRTRPAPGGAAPDGSVARGLVQPAAA